MKSQEEGMKETSTHTIQTKVYGKGNALGSKVFCKIVKWVTETITF